jgi:predicted DNA-binding transcriptional regulator AlpA
MDSKFIQIKQLKADVRNALANKKIANTDCQLLRIRDVSKLTTLSKSCIQLWVAQGRFPKPLTLSATIKVWRASQITEWLKKYEGEVQ